MTNVGTFREAIKKWRMKKDEQRAAKKVAGPEQRSDGVAVKDEDAARTSTNVTDSVDVELGEGEAEELDSAPVLRIIAKSEVLDLVSKEEWLYRRDTPSAFFTLVLSGKLEVFSGRDKGKFHVLAHQFLLARLATPTLDLRLSTMTRSNSTVPHAHTNTSSPLSAQKTRIATTAHVMESVP